MTAGDSSKADASTTEVSNAGADISVINAELSDAAEQPISYNELSTTSSLQTVIPTTIDLSERVSPATNNDIGKNEIAGKDDCLLEKTTNPDHGGYMKNEFIME